MKGKVKHCDPLPTRKVDHFKLAKCSRCGSEVETVFTIVGFNGKKVVDKIDLCQSCYMAPSIRGAFIDNA